MDTYLNKVFVSYARSRESEDLVNKIDESLQKRGITIVRDSRDLKYKDSKVEFMKQIGRGTCIIVIISDEYLCSQECMFELVEIAGNKEFRDRIFPIILAGVDIQNPVKRLKYVKYWEEQKKELIDALRGVDPANLRGIHAEVDNYESFRDEISGLTTTLSDMNALTPEVHQNSNFEILCVMIEERIRKTTSQGNALFDETVFNKLLDLPAELLERIIFKFNKSNIIPGHPTPHAVRIAELIKLVHMQENGIDNLWVEVDKLKKFADIGAETNSVSISHKKIKELLGILIDPEIEVNIEDVVRYSFAQVKNTINSDLLRNTDESIISAIIWNLGGLDHAPDMYPDLLAFAVLCHDHLAGMKQVNVEKKIKGWIESVCAGTRFNLELIRSDFPKQELGKVHRVAIEIAWRNRPSQFSRENYLPEVYMRWGRLRQRFDRAFHHSDRHQVLTEILAFLKDNENDGLNSINHVEVLLDPQDMHLFWEYQPEEMPHAEAPVWQPYPLVVRLLSKNGINKRRSCPNTIILDMQIACSEHHGEQFLEMVQDKGVFVSSHFAPEDEKPSSQIKTAIEWASIGVWTRNKFSKDDQLRQVLVDCPIDDVPGRIHSRRMISSPESVWREVVALFDPNLQPFKFSFSDYDSKHQQLTNAALG